jgi:hypothetical protein
MPNNVVYQTSYTPTIRPAVAGMPGTMHGYNADSRICETVAGIGFGLAVSQGTGDKGAILGGSAPVGASLRDITLIHALAQQDMYSQLENMGVLVDGDIWVQVSTAVTPATAVTYDPATGIFAATGTAFPRARWIKGSSGAGLALLRINQP